MLERRCRVVQIGQGHALLRAEPGSCSGCVGCSGRCGLLPGSNLEISVGLADIDGELREDGWARLSLHESTLRNEALHGYGLPLAGMLAGAVLGYFIALPLGLPTDVATAVAAFAGTLLSLSRSKRGATGVVRVRPESASS
ncbi:MAG: SoxR reducing system RseC family protein [Pseudomarimonas sp.]